MFVFPFFLKFYVEERTIFPDLVYRDVSVLCVALDHDRFGVFTIFL